MTDDMEQGSVTCNENVVYVDGDSQDTLQQVLYDSLEYARCRGYTVGQSGVSE